MGNLLLGGLVFGFVKLHCFLFIFIRCGCGFGLTPSVYEGNVVQAVQFYRQASWIASADGSSSSVAVPTLSGLTPHRHPSSLQQQTITISLHIWGVELFLLLKNSTLLYVSLWMCILQVLQIPGISLAKTRVSFYFLFSSLHGKDRFLNGVSSASRR